MCLEGIRTQERPLSRWNFMTQKSDKKNAFRELLSKQNLPTLVIKGAPKALSPLIEAGPFYFGALILTSVSS